MQGLYPDACVKVLRHVSPCPHVASLQIRRNLVWLVEGVNESQTIRLGNLSPSLCL